MSADAAALADALRALDVDADVEVRGRLAIVVPRGAAPDLADAALRRRLHALAVAHGFADLALELEPSRGARPTSG